MGHLTCRIRQLQGWIAKWDCPQLDCGFPKEGAMDAWLNTALQIERARLSNQQFAGASVAVSSASIKSADPWLNS